MNTSQNDKPYLCGGTFLTQLYEIRVKSLTPTDYIEGKKDTITSYSILEKLISIFRLSSDFSFENDSFFKTNNNNKELKKSSLKTNISDFKNCNKSIIQRTGFTNPDFKMDFDNDVRKGTNSKSLSMMSDFISEFLDKSKHQELVANLRGIIKQDPMPCDTKFTVLNEEITKESIVSMSDFYIEPFLLGIWHYIIINRAKENEKGRKTIENWYPDRKMGIDENDRDKTLGKYINPKYKKDDITVKRLADQGIPTVEKNKEVTCQTPEPEVWSNEDIRVIYTSSIIDNEIEQKLLNNEIKYVNITKGEKVPAFRRKCIYKICGELCFTRPKKRPEEYNEVYRERLANFIDVKGEIGNMNISGTTSIENWVSKSKMNTIVNKNYGKHSCVVWFELIDEIEDSENDIAVQFLLIGD